MSRFARWFAILGFASALVACGGGSYEPPVPPTVVIRATAQAATNDVTAALQSHLGGAVSLDGSGSTAASGSIAAYVWTVSARPVGSTASLVNANGVTATFLPDQVGDYVLGLKVTDDSGGSSSATVKLAVAEALPRPSVITSVTFTGSLTTLPTRSVWIGANVVLDGASSSVPGGGAVTLDWTLVDKPGTSAAALAIVGSRASFTPDIAGTYSVHARGTTAAGAMADVVHVFNAGVSAPTVLVSTSISTIGTSSALNAAVGNLVSLNGGTSNLDPAINYTTSWVVVSKPDASNLSALNSPDGIAVAFVPDVPGTYAVQFTLRDNSSGQSSFHTVFVSVVLGPTAHVIGNAAPVASATGPSFVAAIGTEVTLRGTGSFDPAGAALTYRWSLLSQPAGSATSLSVPTAATTVFTPDRAGSYLVELAVTTNAGLTALQQVTVYAGAYPPVAAVDRSQLAVLLGSGVTASAAASYSQSGNALAYSWAIDSRPAGSTATIADPTAAILSFTPDVAGPYTATVTVSDGPLNAVAPVVITAFGASAGTVPLTYVPVHARFSKSLGKAIIASDSPYSLHLVDPAAATDLSIALPAAVKAMSLSPDGSYAVVLHEGAVSFVDLNAAQLVRSSAAGGSPSDAFVSNAGVIYLVGQTGGQWVTPGFTVLDGRTGTQMQSYDAFASIYGTTRGVSSAVTQKIFTLSEGLSPTDVRVTTVDPATALLVATTDSPYHGDYSMANPMWLSVDETLLFTGSGNYFRTSDLRYAGTLGVNVQSVSQAASTDELLAAQGASSYVYPGGYQVQYAAALKRYTGSLLFPAADLSLPKLLGEQAYGIGVFHRADDRRVVLVQTGSNLSQSVDARYYLIMLP